MHLRSGRLCTLAQFHPPTRPTSAPRCRTVFSSSKPQPDPLSRPLGTRQLPELPSSLSTKVDSELRRVLVPELNQSERKHLVKEAGKGYFHDLKATHSFGGKTWIAPTRLIREDKALYFPTLYGKNLIGTEKNTTESCFGKISVIALESSQISAVHNAAYLEYVKDLEGKIQVITINNQHTLLRSLLVSLYTSSLRSSIPAAKHKHYWVSSQNLERIKGDLGCDNKYLGYIYVVDESLRVRWAAGGEMWENEGESLSGCVRELLERKAKHLVS